jgi:hypothetical protein
MSTENQAADNGSIKWWIMGVLALLIVIAAANIWNADDQGSDVVQTQSAQ